MMKSFDFYSDYLNMMLSVEVNINATKDESWVKSIDLYDETGEFISKLTISSDELRELNALADDMAQEYHADAYQGMLDAKSDMAYDDYKDNDKAYEQAQGLINESGYDYMVSDENE